MVNGAGELVNKGALRVPGGLGRQECTRTLVTNYVAPCCTDSRSRNRWTTRLNSRMGAGGTGPRPNVSAPAPSWGDWSRKSTSSRGRPAILSITRGPGAVRPPA